MFHLKMYTINHFKKLAGDCVNQQYITESIIHKTSVLDHHLMVHPVLAKKQATHVYFEFAHKLVGVKLIHFLLASQIHRFSGKFLLHEPNRDLDVQIKEKDKEFASTWTTW